MYRVALMLTLAWLVITPASAGLIERVPARRIDPAFAVTAAPTIDVRLAGEPELARIGMTSSELVPAFMASLLIPAAGGAAALPPLYVVGASTFITLSAAYAFEERRQRIVEGAMAPENFISALREALARRLGALPSAGTEVPKLSVAFSYGVSRKPAPLEIACVVANASIKVEQRGAAVYEDVVHIEIFRRSADAPPPVCHGFAELTRDQGALLKQAVAETAEIFAAIIVRRLQAG